MILKIKYIKLLQRNKLWKLKVVQYFKIQKIKNYNLIQKVLKMKMNFKNWKLKN